MSGAVELLAQAEVGQDSVDLLAQVKIRQDSIELLGKFTLRQLTSDLLSNFRVRCTRRFGDNWQRKMWFDGTYYWRGRCDLAAQEVIFEYIAAAGLAGNEWTKNENASIDCLGWAADRIKADFTVRGGESGIPTTIHYSNGVDSIVAESDEAGALNWGWENTTTVFDGGVLGDTYWRVNLCANRTTPTPKLWVIAVFNDDSENKQWVKARRQTTRGNLLIWDGEDPVSDVNNTSEILGCSGRSMGDAGPVKPDIMVVYKEGAALKSKYYDGDWDDPIEVIDATTIAGKAKFDFEHGELGGENEGHVVYVDGDNSVQWMERAAGPASVWLGPTQLHAAIHPHYGVGIVEHGSGWLWVVWVNDIVIEYRLHLCGPAPETWFPLLVDPPLIFDTATEAVINTSTIEQPQTPDWVPAGEAVPMIWIGETAPETPCAIGWGLLREAAKHDLLAKFVSQATQDLLGKFEAQATQNLLGKVDITHSVELLGKFEAQATRDLLGKADITHSVDLLGKVGITHSVDLLGRVDVTHSADLLGRAEVGQDSQNLLGRVEVGQDSQDLLGKVGVTHSVDLLGKVDITHSVDLLGKADITHSVDLLGKVDITHSVDLLGKADITHSVELLGKFEAQATRDLLGKADITHSVDLLGKVGVTHSVDLLGKVDITHSVDLLGKADITHSVDLLGKVDITHSVDLLGKADITHSVELLGKFEAQATRDLLGKADITHSVDLLGKVGITHSVDLLGKGIIRHEATVELFGKCVIRHSATKDLDADVEIVHWEDLYCKSIIRHTATLDLPAIFWTRWPSRLWTSRRYVNGVIELDEKLLGDAFLEYVIEGVMEDTQGYLDNAGLSYSEWTEITLVPVQILRAVTYGTVAALFARHTLTFRSQVIPSITPVTVTVIGDAEKAMNYWEDRMNQMLEFYVTSQGGDVMLTSTPDEEPVFSMEDIPEEVTEFVSWRIWLQERGN